MVEVLVTEMTSRESWWTVDIKVRVSFRLKNYGSPFVRLQFKECVSVCASMVQFLNADFDTAIPQGVCEWPGARIRYCDQEQKLKLCRVMRDTHLSLR